MPINIPDNLPASEVLSAENIFTMVEERAQSQDIRPLQIAILNLMPTKMVTETQLLRLLSNSPIQVDIELLHPKSYKPKHTPEEHLLTFYKTHDEVKEKYFDGLVITGAPVENMEFEEVDYWDELVEIMEWSKTNVYSTFHICWGAQAALYYHYGVRKLPLKEKLFGIFPHRITKPNTMLLRGFDDVFMVPHSRYTESSREDIEKFPELDILAESDEAGIYIIKNDGGRQIFVTGHSEYDPLTLKEEYDRDVRQGISINVPKNYFPDDDVNKPPIVNWRGHANLLYSNWLNYFVYQETPYDLADLRKLRKD